MAWIESHQRIARHPKTVRLAGMLGITRVQTVGHLHFLWWWALDYADDGDLIGLSSEEIALAAEWEGDADVFVDALLQTGWLDRTGDNLAVHDWWEYAGKLVDRRQRNAERMRKARSGDSAEHGNTDENARVQHVQGTSRARVQLHNTTQPNTTESAVETTSITSGAAREGNTAAAVCEHLAIPMESEPGELVTEAVEHYTDLPHLLEAKKCRTHYGSSWGKWTVAHRAQQFAKWLEKTDLFRRTDAEKYSKGRDSPPDTPVTPETAEDKAWVDRFYAGQQEAANRRRAEQRT